MSLRKAEIRDKKDILGIVNLLSLDIPGFVWNADEFVTRQIKKGEYFVLELNNKIVGIISFRERNKKMHIETLAVRKDYQSNSVGTRLIEFAKDFAREKNFKILRAYSFYEYKSVDFYLNQGFYLLNKPGIYNKHKYYRFEIRL